MALFEESDNCHIEKRVFRGNHLYFDVCVKKFNAVLCSKLQNHSFEPIEFAGFTD